MNFYNKSLLTRINTDSLFGIINSIDYYLFDFHTLLSEMMWRITKADKEEILNQYREQFIYYYF